jgi:hypothetical protein
VFLGVFKLQMIYSIDLQHDARTSEAQGTRRGQERSHGPAQGMTRGGAAGRLKRPSTMRVVTKSQARGANGALLEKQNCFCENY